MNANIEINRTLNTVNVYISAHPQNPKATPPVNYNNPTLNALLQKCRIGIGKPIDAFPYKFLKEKDYTVASDLANNPNGIDALDWAFRIMQKTQFYTHDGCICESTLRALVSTYNEGLDTNSLNMYYKNIVRAIHVSHRGATLTQLKGYASAHYDANDKLTVSPTHFVHQNSILTSRSKELRNPSGSPAVWSRDCALRSLVTTSFSSRNRPGAGCTVSIDVCALQ